MNSERLKPIDVSQIDLDELKKRTSDIPGLIEYAHSIGGFSVVPTKEGDIKSKAMSAMQEQTQMQLDMLLEQMKLLAKQAQELKDRASISECIYEAKLSFRPVIGEEYYLYSRSNGEKLLSLISPIEWGKSFESKYLAHVQLLADHTWKVLNKSEEF